MSGPEESDNSRKGDESQSPTASFDGLMEPGSQIGQFRIERELGRGAMGIVYLAHDTKLDRQVAIKSLSAGVLKSPSAKSRFSREARVLASLNHPGIAAIYDELQPTEEPGYLVLEYVPGQTLAERITAGRPSLKEALSIAGQIAEAVAAAHDCDVIHRDLKPGNIKITPEDKVKVLDFGLAKAVGAESRPARRFCVTLDPENPLIAGGGRGSLAPSFTRDGRKMVYTAAAGGETWVAVRSMDSLAAQRIRGTNGAIWAAASPSGKWLVFVTPRDTCRVPLTGGPPERLTGAVAFVWEDENTLICRPFDKPAGLYRLDIESGQLQPLRLPPTRGNITVTQLIHFDQRSRTLFYTSPGSQVETSAAFALSMDTGEHKLLVERTSVARYVPSGHLVYVQPGRLTAVPFNIDTLEITGTAVDVTEERMATDEGLPSFAFSPDGTLVYVPIRDSQDVGRVLVWVDMEGHEALLGTRPMAYRSVSISDDAKRPQVIGDVFPEGNVWIYDVGGESPVRSLTLPAEGFCWSPVWVPPDNREVVFVTADEDSGLAFKRKDADGSGQARELFSLVPGSTDWLFLLPKSFNPDGKTLLAAAYGTTESATGADIAVIYLEPSVEARPLLASEHDEYSPVFSPDGKWLAFVSNESGRNELIFQVAREYLSFFCGLK